MTKKIEQSPSDLPVLEQFQAGVRIVDRNPDMWLKHTCPTAYEQQDRAIRRSSKLVRFLQDEGLLVGSDGIVIDVACGRGDFIEGIAKAYPGTCIGVDCNDHTSEWLESLQSAPNLHFLRADINTLLQEFGPRSIRLLTITFSLDASKPPDNAIGDDFFLGVPQILEPGGVFAINDQEEHVRRYTGFYTSERNGGFTVIPRLPKLDFEVVLQKPAV